MEQEIILGSSRASNALSNKISTTKYNIFTFFPKAIFYLLMRLANCFFLATSIFISFPGVAPLSPLTVVVPFLFIVVLTLTKEAVEDLVRFT